MDSIFKHFPFSFSTINYFHPNERLLRVLRIRKQLHFPQFSKFIRPVESYPVH